MNNVIDSIQLSGTSYTLQDSEASRTVELSQAEYDALTTKDPNVFYIITDSSVDYINSAQCQTQIDNSISGKTNLSDFTGHTADTTVHVTAADKTAWNAKSDFSGDYNDLANKLSAGTNITIDANNVISAEGGGGKAVTGGTNISVTTGETVDTINCTLPIIATSSVFNTISVGQGSGGGSYNTLIGANAKCDTSNGHNVFLVAQKSSNSASGAYVNGTHNVIIGSIKDGYLNFSIQSFNTSRSVVIGGGGISTDKDNSVAIGYQANVSGTTKTNINNQLTIDTSNQVYIYNKDNTEMICLQDQLGGGGSSYTAGDGIDITNGVISVTGMTDESAFTAHTADTTIHVTAQDKSNWNAKSDFSGDYDDLTNKPTIPTSASQLANDAGYITSSALNDYATTGDVQTATNDMATKTWVGQQGYLTQHQDISGKQDVSGMTAYTQTTAFTAHTGDTTIHVTSSDKTSWNGAVTSLGGLSLVKLTQTQYDNLANKDNNTLYVIVN